WLDSRRSASLVAYVLCSVLAVYVQPLFVVMYIVHVAYVLERGARGMTIAWSTTLATAVAISLLLLPLALALPPVWERRMAMSAASSAAFRGWGDARFALGPLTLIAAAALVRRRVPAYYMPPRAPLVLLACWSALPELLILGCARWISPSVLVSR